MRNKAKRDLPMRTLAVVCKRRDRVRMSSRLPLLHFPISIPIYRVFIKYYVFFENFKIYSGLWAALGFPALLCTRTT